MIEPTNLSIVDLQGLTVQRVLEDLHMMGHTGHSGADFGRTSGDVILVGNLCSSNGSAYNPHAVVALRNSQHFSSWGRWRLTGAQWRQFVSLRLEQIQERDRGQWDELDDDDYEIEW